MLAVILAFMRTWCKRVATSADQNMFSSNKSKALCIVCMAVITSGCGNVTESLSPDYHEKRGLAFFEQGEYQKAEEELKLAISLAARDSGPKAGPIGRMNAELANLYKKQDKLEFADEGYRRALIVFSEKPELLNDADREAWVACLRNYAEVLRKTERGDEAGIRESQAQRILEKMGKAAPAATTPPTEKAAPAVTPPDGKPEDKPAPTAPPTTKDQPETKTPEKPAPKTPEDAKPETKAAPKEPAAKSPPDTAPKTAAPAKSEPQPAATTPPAAKPTPDKSATKPAATTPPAAKPAPAKSGPKPASTTPPAAKPAPAKTN